MNFFGRLGVFLLVFGANGLLAGLPVGCVARGVFGMTGATLDGWFIAAFVVGGFLGHASILEPVIRRRRS